MVKRNFVDMNWFDILIWAWMGVGVITFIVLVWFKIRAPYGRHATSEWGKMIPNRLGWFLMELPALVLTPVIALTGPSEKDWFAWLIIGVWEFNGFNGFVNGFFIGYFYTPDPLRSISDPLIITGLVLFAVGMYINNAADTKLISLRKQKAGYQIPRKWLFEYISCPNHFGEIVEWTGYAVIDRK